MRRRKLTGSGHVRLLLLLLVHIILLLLCRNYFRRHWLPVSIDRTICLIAFSHLVYI